MRERERGLKIFVLFLFCFEISHSPFFFFPPPLPSSLPPLPSSLTTTLSHHHPLSPTPLPSPPPPPPPTPKLCVDQPDKYCNLLEHTFVILGATSAMGPIDVLLRYGATVIAIDIDREPTWNFLLNKVRNSPGRLIMPVLKSKVAEEALYNEHIQAASPEEALTYVQTFLDGLFVEKPATPKMLRCGPVMYDLAKANSDTKKSLLGCNLLEETPSISRWLRDCVENKSVVPNKQKLTIGNYTYLDGELHVRLSVACNEIILQLCNDNRCVVVENVFFVFCFFFFFVVLDHMKYIFSIYIHVFNILHIYMKLVSWTTLFFFFPLFLTKTVIQKLHFYVHPQIVI